MKTNRDFSLVIPVFNEMENLKELIRRCLLVCNQTGLSFEVILIDDGSTDGSERTIAKAARDNKKTVTGVILNRNYGQHAAIIAGLSRSCGEIVITLDADLQNPPEEIPKLLQQMNKGFDVVGTIRTNRHDCFFRKCCSRLVNRVVRRSTGVMMHDYGCMLRAYSRPVVNAILQCREQSTFIPILANTFARNTSEIHVQHASRSGGTSKYSVLKLISLQFDLLTSMSTFPLRLLSFIGTVIAVIGISFGTFLMIMRFLHGAAWAAQGVFTLFAVLFIFIGAQFIGMGLLGEYVGRIYRDVRARPRYFVHAILTGEENDISGLSPETGKTMPENNSPLLEDSYESCCPCLS